MAWTMPGTVLEADPTQAQDVEQLFTPLFAAGGLILSQVSSLTGLEPHTIQNWVKRGFLTPPEKKKYNSRQLSRILIINMLKSAMSMDSICQLLSYVNGALNDESDDIIDDSVMYGMFFRLAAENQASWPPRDLDRALDRLLLDYEEPAPGAKRRVASALRVMLTAWMSSELQKQAAQQLKELGL